MNTWEAAYSALEDLSDYKDNALGLFALGLRFGLDDLSSIGVDAVTDGSDDKKLDIVFINSEEEYAVVGGFAPIFPDICYHLTHYKPAAADIPVASDNPAHYADAIRYNARTPLQGSLLPLTRLVWA
ncbi:hypothetical protein VEE61_09920 [Escherichia coli]|nr:hypothetical protein VEE61_09920 [Escherichia coli]